MMKITITVLALFITYGNCCNCPTGYVSGDSCKILLTRLPCNTTVPKCKCPEDYIATHDSNTYFKCVKDGATTPCVNNGDLRDFVSKLAAESTWSLPPHECHCQEVFRVVRNGNRVLCEHPHSHWAEIPCGFPAPPVCECERGTIHGLSDDEKKAEYNSAYGCVGGNGKVGSCLNENDIQKYYTSLVEYFQ